MEQIVTYTIPPTLGIGLKLELLELRVTRNVVLKKVLINLVINRNF